MDFRLHELGLTQQLSDAFTACAALKHHFTDRLYFATSNVRGASRRMPFFYYTHNFKSFGRLDADVALP
jgi:hypothetical protein